jgi:hypothetical protein
MNVLAKCNRHRSHTSMLSATAPMTALPVDLVVA